MNFNLEGGPGPGPGHGHGHGNGWRARHNRRSGGDGSGGDGGDGDGGDGGSGDDDRRTWRINRREQRWIAIHGLYVAFNGLLYVLIQIKYQVLDNSPFKTHMAMTTSLVALCVYICAAMLQIILVQTNNKLNDPRLLNHVILCFGGLFMLSNILVFLPDMVGWIVVVLFVFATTILLTYDVFKLITNYISERNNINITAAPTPE